MRKLLLLLSVLMPQPVKQAIYRRLMRWQIGSNVNIGFSYIDSAKIILGDDVRIGHFNIIRGIKHLSVGEGTYIANFNQMFGAPHPNWACELLIGKQVSFMSRHFIDVGGAVSIGDGAIIGGRDTQFWSHTLAFRDGKPSLEPTSLHIGAGVYVGARATLVSCVVPDGALVGAGSVVTKSFPPESCRLLIAGNPAAIRKRYDNMDTDPIAEMTVAAHKQPASPFKPQ